MYVNTRYPWMLSGFFPLKTVELCHFLEIDTEVQREDRRYSAHDTDHLLLHPPTVTSNETGQFIKMSRAELLYPCKTPLREGVSVLHVAEVGLRVHVPGTEGTGEEFF